MVTDESGSSTERTLLEHPRAFETILYGGLVVGILDGLFALTFYGLIMEGHCEFFNLSLQDCSVGRRHMRAESRLSFSVFCFILLLRHLSPPSTTWPAGSCRS